MAKINAAVCAAQQESVLAPNVSHHTAPSDPQRDILLQFPSVEVHKVEGKEESLLVRGSLVAYSVVYPTGEHRLALEVGEMRWWLLTDTASLKVAPSTYMMSLPGGQTFYSITFAEETPAEAVGAFEALLQEVSVYREAEALMEEPALVQGDAKIAAGLSGLVFQNKLARGIHSTSMKVADGVLVASNYASGKFAERTAATQSASAPGKQRSVPVVVKFTAASAKKGAHLVARVADKVVNVAAAAPVYVVEKMMRKSTDDSKPQGMRKQVVTASAISFTVIWTAMECGARTVLVGARDHASGVVHHKYGPEAAGVTHNTLTACGHGVDAYTSVRNIAAKAIMRKTAKTAAKCLLANYMGKVIPKGMDAKAAAKLSVRERLDAITARGGATIVPVAAAAGSGSEAHRQMLEFHRCRGLLMPPPAELETALADTPPAIAQKKAKAQK